MILGVQFTSTIGPSSGKYYFECKSKSINDQ